MPQIFGIVGFKGSGKDTAAGFLIKNNNFVKDSFAKSLKDACSLIFGWDRDMLEGETIESREWREVVDDWWAKELGIEDFSPRKALQLVGTEVFRQNLHNNIWAMTVENRLRNTTNDTVLTDCRFPNEIQLIKQYGGKVIRIKRGDEPEWFEQALEFNKHREINPLVPVPEALENIHASERDWIGQDFDYTIDNNGTLEDLECKMTELMNSMKS